MIVEGDLPTSFELPAKTLAELIDRTRFAISTEETRYYLNGIFLHVRTRTAGAQGCVRPTAIAWPVSPRRARMAPRACPT